MSKKIIANLIDSEQSRIAILDAGKLSEIFIDYNLEENTGDIFKARVDAIIPAINAAFVKISKSNAYLYINEEPKLKNLKVGHEVLVQVVKNARKFKAPRVSTKISISGRWLILVPNDSNSEVGVSRRISDNSERKRLKKFAESIKIQGFGIIIRTSAENISEELLQKDFEEVLELWHEIEKKFKNSHAPCLLYHDSGILGKILREGDVDEVIIDNKEEFERAKSLINENENLQFYDEITPIFEYFDIERDLYKALDRKIWLKSGAYLVIDQTEALTVIDVNSGKFTTAPDMRHTILSTNLEAAEEIARQLRLRSIGGIIIVDFIDMDSQEDKNELLKHFEKFLNKDRLLPKVYGLTKLGLVELTRKRERPDLKSILERDENIAMNIKRFIRKITRANNSEMFLIQTSSYIAKYLKDYIGKWEKELYPGRKIIIEPVAEFPRDKFRLEYQGKFDTFAIKK